jgi:hypothetical protein
MAQGGEGLECKEKLGKVLATGLDLRKKFGRFVVSIPILLYLLIHNGASWLTALVINNDSSFCNLIRFMQAGTSCPFTKNQVAVRIGRLFLSLLSMFLFPWAFIAILAAGLQEFGKYSIRKCFMVWPDENQQADSETRNRNFDFGEKRIMPTSIYYCVSRTNYNLANFSVWNSMCVRHWAG